MSPWIKGVENKKNSVFIDERGPAIETFLQDEKREFLFLILHLVKQSQENLRRTKRVM